MIPLLTWMRLKDAPIDRDYAPYAYPAVMGTGYLEDGHTDIKPPLIHWSYKLWWKTISLMPTSLTESAKLRLLPLLGLSLASVLCATQSPLAGLTLALLCASPALWVHMANTEWLTVLLWSLALASGTWGGPWPWLFLGLTPWANQKNVLLLAPVAWALGCKISPTDLAALCLPSLVAFGYLALTSRLATFWEHCVTIPASFGKDRSFRVNTLTALHLLKPGLALLVLTLAVCDWHSPWMLVAVAVVAVSVASKQVVPHHFIALAFPLALAAQPGPLWFVAFACLASQRDWLVLWRPEYLYPLTFWYRDGRNYGDILKDGREVVDYLRMQKDASIWVNGWENQLYLEAGKKAAQINVPELKRSVAEPPRLIVHCTNGAQDFDYEGYEMEFMTVGGFYTVMRRA